jgi:hypothetical protein
MTNIPVSTAAISPVRGGGQTRTTRWSMSARPLVVATLLTALLALVAGATPGTAAAAGPGATPAADDRFDVRTQARFARALQATWASTWAPGVIVGVWVGDRGWTSVRGSTRRAAGPRPVLGEHTRIGSVTKTMTGTLILQLVDQRKLRLNETIERWFPQLPDARNITIRDLGSMSSGIASYTTDSVITNRYFTHPTMAWNPDTLIAGGAALPRLFTPGNGFNYSDTNFVMLEALTFVHLLGSHFCRDVAVQGDVDAALRCESPVGADLYGQPPSIRAIPRRCSQSAAGVETLPAPGPRCIHTCSVARSGHSCVNTSAISGLVCDRPDRRRPRSSAQSR